MISKNVCSNTERGSLVWRSRSQGIWSAAELENNSCLVELLLEHTMREWRGAEARDDFAHKLQMTLKELRESNYWLRLLAKAGTCHLADGIDESNQLRAILWKAVATTKGRAE
jgi:hypothetical protein